MPQIQTGDGITPFGKPAHASGKGALGEEAKRNLAAITIETIPI